MKDLLVITNHHRRSSFFEDSTRRLKAAGCSILIQETGGGEWGSYQGYSDRFVTYGPQSYDQSMVALAVENSYISQFPYILFLDNDCFLSGTEYLEKYLAEFVAGDYDFASHVVGKEDAERYRSDSLITTVENQQFHECNVYPHFSLSPHWENSYTLMKSSLWTSLEPAILGHTRRWLKAIHDKGCKMGAHRANHRMSYTHFGPEWFHVGNLMRYYYFVEAGAMKNFSTDSSLDMSRLGFFLFQEEIYGPGSFHDDLASVPIETQVQAREAWAQLTEGTCMQDWS
tara:strand:- start:2268 stop:3122 length:855 start_codon:yes stop_codon:yes gene_type:complete